MPKPRKSIAKGMRFEVFKRDHFTCQYCGAQPPNVVLVIDHILPVAKGGDNDISNLVSSCEACNTGKSDKDITARQIRPDADLLFLETQQEISELRRYQEAKAVREGAIKDTVEVLQAHWCNISGLDWCPADHVLRRMLLQYTPEQIELAVEVTGPHVASGWVARDTWPNFMWGVLHKRKESNGQD